jgi:hypothetical protein
MNKISLLCLFTILLLNAPTLCETPEEIFLNETFYSGFIPIREKADIFYWWFPSLSKPSTDPLVFWLTGGPGCSSEVALFYENGKQKKKTIKIKK